MTPAKKLNLCEDIEINNQTDFFYWLGSIYRKNNSSREDMLRVAENYSGGRVVDFYLHGNFLYSHNISTDIVTVVCRTPKVAFKLGGES